MRNYLMLLLIIVSISALSQTDYRPGYYIDLNKDTVFGLLDYRGDMRNAKKCEFKKDANSDVLNFEPFQILSYRFTDSKYYISKTVKVGEQEMNVFVEFLVNGIADLYYFRDTNSDHFFIENKDFQLVELTNKPKEIQKDGQTYLQNTNKHVGLLKATFSDCPEIQKQIDNARLTSESLMDITVKYHEYVCDGEKCIVYTKKVPKVLVRFAPIIGISVSSVKIDLAYNNFYEIQNFGNSINPTLGLLINISMSKQNEKLSLQFATELSKSYYYSLLEQSSYETKTYYDTHLRTTLLENTLGVQYTYPKNKLRPTFALGALFNYYLNIESKIVKEEQYNGRVRSFETIESPFSPYLLGAFAQMGCNYHLNNKRIIFAKLKYAYSSTLMDDNRLTFNSLNLSLGIYL